MKSKLAKRLAALGVSAAAAIGGGFLIVPYEGEVKNKNGLHTVYLDPIGIPTVCYGNTGKDLYGRTIQLGMTYTQDECEKMLAQFLIKFEKDVDRLVRNNYASPWMKAALVSYTWNVGTGNLQRSTLRQHVIAGKYEEACDELLKWVYAGGKKLSGLVRRRGEEREWCLGNVDDLAATSTYLEIMKDLDPYFKDRGTKYVIP